MYNLHCHSLLSDGELLPSEVAVRYMDKGYKAIAITDHSDYGNISSNARSIVEFSRHWPKDFAIRVFPGIELTHIPPEQFKPLTKLARSKGIKIIIAHGETPVEPMIAGTNRAALESDIDILAHPGKITDEDVKLARDKGIFLEVTTRKGHSLANAYVIKKALKFGARLIINTDSHSPDDIISPEKVIAIARKSGLSLKQIEDIYKDVANFLGERGKK
ncbi:MAG: histidinol phosphate phosphatase domain-containing protein [Candidatus Omnitrophota bacterium]|nr:histidinol phosphate phosphatase domain-containing protein [Candidatus Omnitrophota bacterium]MBU1929072.1 histidinol phosphate phosphatase domain-containing protein [Candidatus Omnitrophota bacterium]MBU1929177.1 histidinol phosphate phosphatase domain-containing protein [Candidatus Omnitrophota bacterium]MBU2035057.1 histidinol phosphate phosphatase domain-containing protein [Candidatus Omnitrophota bacterium]MBU2258258.1 histidinol phosphate phosphatase domain-containing protein [Candidat